MITKPDRVFDRDTEWRTLTSFCRVDTSPGLHLAVVYGRRRQGKSYLLRAVHELTGGVFHLALQDGGEQSRRDLADHASHRLGVQLPSEDWNTLLTGIVEALGRVSENSDGAFAPTLVLDEYPWLLRDSPELSSVLHGLYERFGPHTNGPAIRIILCGSAFSVMSDLLSGSQPLRGRAMYHLRVGPMRYRDMIRYWGVDDPELALKVYSVFGGVPGYRDLVPAELRHPADSGTFDTLVTSTILDPAHALSGELEYLMREDPRITNPVLYHSVLRAIADGGKTPTKVGALLGRERTAVQYPLDVLVSAGLVERRADVLNPRNTDLRLSDPTLRFAQIIVHPRIPQLDYQSPMEVWQYARDSYHSQILGPVFEDVARDHVRYHRGELSLPDPTGAVGSAQIACKECRKSHEIDIVLVNGSTVRVIGEAKATTSPRRPSDVRRLEHLRDVLAARPGTDAAGAKLAVYSMSGFDPALLTEAADRPDVELVDLPRLAGVPHSTP